MQGDLINTNMEETAIEKVNLNDLKAQAFDLIRIVGKKQQEVQQLSQQILQIEAQIAELEKLN